MITLALIINSLVLSAYAGVSSWKRGSAQLITSCSVSNTVALTFVRFFTYFGLDDGISPRTRPKDDGPHIYM